METNGNGNDHTKLEIVAESSLSLIIKAEIDASVSTAKAYPRSLKLFLSRAMSMATISEEVAASCSYALPRSGKSLEGPSVRLAEIVCSSYGNIRAGARVIANDGKTITAQGICHDLETNYSVTVEVKRRITDRNGKTYNEDMQVVTGNAACAVAYRNAVFKVVPFALVNDVYDKAKEVARGTSETLPTRRDKALAYLRGLKVTDKQICDILEIKRVEDIDLDKLDTLRGMVTLIKNGESTVKDLFESDAASKDSNDKKEAASAKEAERVANYISKAKTVEQLDEIFDKVSDSQLDLFLQKKEQLSTLKK